MVLKNQAEKKNKFTYLHNVQKISSVTHSVSVGWSDFWSGAS